MEKDITEEVEYVYITIPKEYVCIYTKILILFVDFGIDMLNDCKASCNDKNRKILDCYNMFLAAIAARKLNENKTAETLIKYVEKQIDLMYSKKPPCPDLVYKVTEDGKLLARVDCGNKPKFIVDVTSGTLTSETVGEPTSEYGLSEVDGINTSSTGEGQ